MVSCRFSLKPIHWTLAGARPLSGHVACRNGTLWRKNLEELVVTGFTLKMCYPNIWRNSSSLKSQKKLAMLEYITMIIIQIIIIIEVIIIIDCHVDSFFLVGPIHSASIPSPHWKKCRAIEARGGTTLRRSPTPMTTWKMISTEFFLNGFLSPLEGDYGDDIFLIIVWEDNNDNQW